MSSSPRRFNLDFTINPILFSFCFAPHPAALSAPATSVCSPPLFPLLRILRFPLSVARPSLARSLARSLLWTPKITYKDTLFPPSHPPLPSFSPTTISSSKTERMYCHHLVSRPNRLDRSMCILTSSIVSCWIKLLTRMLLSLLSLCILLCFDVLMSCYD